MTPRRAALALVLPAALALGARAQDGPPAADDLGDPFATPPSLRRAGDGVAATGSASLQATLPGLALRGVLEVAGRPPAALLALGAGPAGREVTVIVRAGDRVTAARADLDVPVDVLAIAQGAVTLRVGGEGGPQVTLR